ncbi:hypothetical protein [Actinomadura nitritigenes]|uniref:hypothetical protein n=1 Tax=Actinomadura nitritigenes TaxID=134602 RepID=UPI003D8FA64B
MTQRAKIVGRGTGYGALSGIATAVLLWLVSSSISTFSGPWPDGTALGWVIPLTLVAATVGALAGAAVGLLAGMIFALSASCLVRHHFLTIAAGLVVPGPPLALLASLLNGTPTFHPSTTTLVICLIAAPSGGLVARPVLLGRRTR